MRSAPARPMTTALICWDTWLMFPANCLVMFRNGTTMLILRGRPEKLRLGAFTIKRILPARATATYSRFPTLFKIGASVLAYRCAWRDTSKSSSFTASKAFSLSSSWQNTLITFWPFIISSTKPSVFPIAFCWLMKYRAELPPTCLMTRSMTATPAATTRAIHTL